MMNTAMPDRHILCVLPGIPERQTGGGILIYEVLAYLATRGRLAVVVPVAKHLQDDFAQISRDPLLHEITWHPLDERRVPGLRGAVTRLLASPPSEVTKYATDHNRQILDAVRRAHSPDVEVAISSFAAAPYPDLTLPPTCRLYMVNVDPDIIRYYGPSLKRKFVAAIDRRKVDRLCRHSLRNAGRVGAISAADVPMLNRMGRRADVAYIPPLMRPQPVDRSRAVANTVLITTNFTYTQNVTSLEWFLRETWPHVDPRATLTITGKDDHDRLATLCQAHRRVSYAGCLTPEAFAEQFATAAVAVNPTRLGSGFQIKLLDAIARGLPIVSTAFSNRIGPAIASSDDPIELARLINARLSPQATPAFDYGDFYREATQAWDRFLFH